MIDKPATYWHMLPAFSQGRKAIWTAVNPHTGKRRIDEAFPHELRVNTNESEMFIRFKNGSTWQVVGSDRYDAAVGSSPAGITFSEWALSNPSAWAYLAPIVIENDGWALFHHDGSRPQPRQVDARYGADAWRLVLRGAARQRDRRDVGGGRRAAAPGIYGHLRQGGRRRADRPGVLLQLRGGHPGRVLGQGDPARRAAGPHQRRAC